MTNKRFTWSCSCDPEEQKTFLFLWCWPTRWWSRINVKRCFMLSMAMITGGRQILRNGLTSKSPTCQRLWIPKTNQLWDMWADGDMQLVPEAEERRGATQLISDRYSPLQPLPSLFPWSSPPGPAIASNPRLKVHRFRLHLSSGNRTSLYSLHCAKLRAS